MAWQVPLIFSLEGLSPPDVVRSHSPYKIPQVFVERGKFMSIEKLRDMGGAAPRIFVYSTGAGAGIQKKIWEVPGCSSFLVGCGFPYVTDLTSKYIGFIPDKFVSPDTAMELAMAAYMMAYEPNHKAVGVGLTASVASTAAHRGAHRVMVSTFSDSECLTFSTEIPKGSGSIQRIVDGNMSDEIGIAAILRAVGLWNSEITIPLRFKDYFASEDYYKATGVKELKFVPLDTTERAKELILAKPLFHSNGMRMSAEMIDNNKVFRYPGSFNPFHFGHGDGAEAIRQTIAKRFGECRDPLYTTVMDPPHKAALTPADMLNKAHAMKNRNFLLTSGDPLFIDKARRNLNGWFGMGADTLMTMLDPKWGIDPEPLLAEMARMNNKLFILGRLIKDDFITLPNIINKDAVSYDLLKKYEDNLLIHVPGRWDISSTELRTKD